MERLTKRVGKHTVIIGCPKAVDRLRKLKQADDEGRYGIPHKPYRPHCGALMRETEHD